MREIALPSQTVAISADQHEMLRDFFDLKSRELSPNTLRGLKTDLGLFVQFCKDRNHQMLPASVSAIREFIRHRSEGGVKAATISRSLSAISKLHSAVDCPDPCRSELVKSELKIARKTTPSRQAQAVGIGYSHLWDWDRSIADSTELADVRDRALMWCLYEGMLRGDEMQRAEVSWIEYLESGEGIMTIPSSKTDQDGEGGEVYLSAHTCAAIKRWLSMAGIESGRIIRSFKVKGGLRDSIHTNGIRQIVGKRGYEMGVIGATNHSPRVGATQNLLEAGESSARIQLAGRWKHERMVIRYGRKHRVTSGAMAELAKKQGRT